MIANAAMDAVRSAGMRRGVLSAGGGRGGGGGRPRQPYTTSPRTITKGNIVYERMPTGEVIASLVKKSEDGGGGRGEGRRGQGGQTRRGPATAASFYRSEV